jgi:lipooligosaccharide transport system permease protein
MHSERRAPGYIHRIYAVWFRHIRVYARNFISNALPPFIEPLIFLAAIGIGLGTYITRMQGVPYVMFLATGLPVTTAMFTSAFECSFATFIRLEFDKVYDGMLGAPLTVNDLILGEIAWGGTKGFFFSFAVVIVSTAFGAVPLPQSFLIPLIGLMTGLLFGALSLFVTSFIKTITHFNFYFTGFISPMFFFSGVVFPLENLPRIVRPIAELVPLTHCVRLARAVAFLRFEPIHVWDATYIVAATALCAFLAVRRLRHRMVD